MIKFVEKEESLEEGLIIKGKDGKNGIEIQSVKSDIGATEGMELTINGKSVVLDKKAVKNLASQLNKLIK